MDYTPEKVGAILTVVGVVALIGRGLLTGLFTRRWGEASVIKASLLMAALGFVFLLAAHTDYAVFFSTGFFVFSHFPAAFHSLR